MRIPGSRADRTATRRVLLAAGLGATFGLQIWQLAEYGFAVSIPWTASAWIVLSHLTMGICVGATAGSTEWWIRGLVLGAVFGIPSAVGTHAAGLTWVPYGFAFIAVDLAVGLVIAFLTDAFALHEGTSTDYHAPTPKRLSDPESTKPRLCHEGGIGQRLAEENDRLGRVAAERHLRGDEGFGKTTEDRIVWGELLELELQDIDEEISRIRAAANDVKEGRSPRPGESTRGCRKEAPMDPTTHGLFKVSSQELAILVELLESERAKLLVEIRHTDHRAFRDELRCRLTLVEGLVERCCAT
jgi:hypothetical protein